jgi:UDP-glucose 4-epimerase
LEDLSKSSLEWKFAILRYFNPVGAHESGLVGENPKGKPSNLLPYITQVVAGKMPYLNIYGDDYETKDGTGERDYIHVMDLAEGHVAALNFLENNFGCHVFNLGSGKPVSVLEIIKVYENENNVKIKKKIMDRRPGDLASYYADSNKAKNFLKWIPRRGINEICSSTHKYLKSNKNS